jgi:hypothetical protein
MKPVLGCSAESNVSSPTGEWNTWLHLQLVLDRWAEYWVTGLSLLGRTLESRIPSLYLQSVTSP